MINYLFHTSNKIHFDWFDWLIDLGQFYQDFHCACAETVILNFRLKFWHHHSIPWPRFSCRARYFGDLRTFSVDLCIGYAECPPYFYFCSSWPTDLESASRNACLAMNVSTKFEVDTTIRCLVIALLLQIRYVTLWHWPLSFRPWAVVNPYTKFDDPTPILSWVMRSDISRGYHWQCVCSHCACAVSRDRCVGGGQIFATYLKPLTPICLFTIQLLWHYDDV